MPVVANDRETMTEESARQRVNSQHCLHDRVLIRNRLGDIEELVIVSMCDQGVELAESKLNPPKLATTYLGLLRAKERV